MIRRHGIFDDMKAQTKRLGLAIILMLAVTVGIVWFRMSSQDPPPPRPVLIMSQPFAIPVPNVGVLDRVMPRSAGWAWLWRFRYGLFGRPKSISINSKVIDLSSATSAMAAQLGQSDPDVSGADGTRVWRLGESDLQALRKLFKETPDSIVTSSSATTSDKGECRMYCGASVPVNGTQQQVGLSLDFLPVIRKGTTDLTATFCFSESVTNRGADGGDSISIRTNFEFAGRFQLPKDTPAVFVLPPAPASTNQKRFALLVTADILRPKK
jgi:hypothetical protein